MSIENENSLQEIEKEKPSLESQVRTFWHKVKEEEEKEGLTDKVRDLYCQTILLFIDLAKKENKYTINCALFWWATSIAEKAGKPELLTELSQYLKEEESGLESLTNEQLVEKAEFVVSDSTAGYTFLNGRLLNKEASPLYEMLGEHLKDRHAQIIDLGAGDYVNEDAKFMKEHFGVESYRAVDRQKRNKVDENLVDGFEKNDTLLFLSKEPDNLSNCMAFGLINEPLTFSNDRVFPHEFYRKKAEKIEIEYAKRFSQEIFRVTPEGGIFFGSGMSDTYYKYLLKAGFVDISSLLSDLSPAAKGDLECFIFYKPKEGEYKHDPLMDAPSEVSKKQLDELGIEISNM